MAIILMHKATKKVLKGDDEVVDFRGDKHILGRLLPFEGKNGKITLKDEMGTFYPSVIGAEFIDDSVEG